MANELKMAIVESIFQLRTLRWSARRIALHLGIDRGTVGKYLKQARSGPKPAIPPAGSNGSKPATHPPAPGGSPPENGSADFSVAAAISKPAISPAGSEGEITSLPSPDAQAAAASPALPAKRGRPSECEPFQSLILEKLQQELSAQRIYQDLTVEHGFTGSYDSVKRFVRQLGRSRPLPMRRMECAAGEEAQVDFGSGAPVIGR